MVVVKNAFGAWDYVVFAAMLVVSLAIGVWFALKGGKQKTQGEHYLMANRNMTIIPVAISILVSFMSAILILGNPAEMYTQVNTTYQLSAISYFYNVFSVVLFADEGFLPTLVSITFQYLERRFNSRTARLIGTFLMILTQIIYMGIATFAPSTALEAVTGFPVWATILSIGAVGTLYTAIGGMKAVIWTDVFQSAIMLAGILAIVIQGAIKVGGFARVWEINEEWKRIKFFNFDPDPTVRHTVWGLVIGSIFSWMGTYGINQASVQRYSSLPTLAKAKTSVMLNMIGVFVLVSLTCLAGIVLFAYYADQNCNPLGQKLVDNSNQLIPYFVMETLGYPGVPGLFISSLFSGALSSVSSSLNALGAITWEDILKIKYDKTLTEYQKTVVTKITVCLYGILAIGVSFIAQQLEGTVLQAAASFIGSVSGPLTGMFVLGAFFPWANSYGVIVGAITGLGLSMWLAIGSYVYGIHLPSKPFPNGTCPAYTNVTMVTTTLSPMTTMPFSTMANLTMASSGGGGRHGFEYFYSISYLWFSTIGMLAVIIIGLVVSFITGANSIHDVPTKYQIPVFSRLCCYLPQSWQNQFNCNRHFESPEDIRSEEKDSEIIVEPPSDKLGFINIAYIADEEKIVHNYKPETITNGVLGPSDIPHAPTSVHPSVYSNGEVSMSPNGGTVNKGDHPNAIELITIKGENLLVERF
ncbi:unnamed protein product [Lymnaea stagnalis]|uniref:Sodium-coupled monocarboxylate transporter 1 n=1 Tax=Lymnaea stagnalis TaxID=6523 RepID=A0AAV2I1T0_LYMST